MLKKPWQKTFMVMAILMVLMLLVATIPACGPAQPEGPIHLLFASWGPPKEPHTDSFEAWKQDLEEKSGGRVEVEISYGGTLGKPPEYYDLALTGVADVSFCALAWTPGRFPISEAMSLPIANATGETGSKAYMELYNRGYLDEELDEVEVMYLFTTSSYVFLWVKDQVNTLDGFKGKKVRCPSGVQSESVKLLGCLPVAKSAPETYTLMQQGIVDANLCPWNMLKSFNLQEVSQYCTDTSIFLFGFAVVMNKDYWNNLPKDIKDIITDMRDSGKYTLIAGQGHDQWDTDAKKMFADAGGVTDHLSSADIKTLQATLNPIWSKYISEYEAQGVKPKEALAELYSIFQELGVSDPFDPSLIQ